MIARYPDRLALALTAADIEREFKRGRLASLLGMEGGHVIENSLGALRSYYDLGARYMTLTHNVTLDWADAAADSARHGGLTEFGREVVREMNRLGMLVDLSHVSPGTMSDALDVTEAPVIFSHSSARALTDHVRNVPDSILERLPKNGGVVMVTFVSAFVSQEVADWEKLAGEEVKKIEAEVSDTAERRRRGDAYEAAHPRPKATLAQVADHIDHVRKVAGADHVAIGSDFDGFDNPPAGLEDVSTLPPALRRADAPGLERRRPPEAGGTQPAAGAQDGRGDGGPAPARPPAVHAHDRAARSGRLGQRSLVRPTTSTANATAMAAKRNHWMA